MRMEFAVNGCSNKFDRPNGWTGWVPSNGFSVDSGPVDIIRQIAWAEWSSNCRVEKDEVVPLPSFWMCSFPEFPITSPLYVIQSKSPSTQVKSLILFFNNKHIGIGWRLREAEGREMWQNGRKEGRIISKVKLRIQVIGHFYLDCVWANKDENVIDIMKRIHTHPKEKLYVALGVIFFILFKVGINNQNSSWPRHGRSLLEPWLGCVVEGEGGVAIEGRKGEEQAQFRLVLGDRRIEEHIMRNN